MRVVNKEIDLQIMRMIAENEDDAIKLIIYNPKLLLDATFKFLDSFYKTKVIDNESLNSWLGYVGNKNRCELFAYFAQNYDMSTESFVNGLRYAYTTGYILDIFTFFSFCSYFKEVDKHLLLTKEELTEFESFPTEMIVYRGGNRNELDNKNVLSFTTDRATAEFFAFRHGTIDRCVYKYVVNKNDISAYFNNRNEFECIIVPDAIEIKTAEIVTDQPTEFYYKYMANKNKVV